jgi:hypothetical protein
MVRNSPATSSGGTIAKIVANLAVLLGPPAAFGAGFSAEIRSHPVRSIALILAYWVALGVVRLAVGVGGELKGMWVPRLANTVDRSVTDTLRRQRKHYIHQLRASVRDVEMVGAATQGEYVLQLPQVYVDLSLVPQPLHDTPHEPFVGTLAAHGERQTLDGFLGTGEHRVFAVIGGPGSGKTTLVRSTALDLCRGHRRGSPLPVLLYLRDHRTAIVGKDSQEQTDAPRLAEVAVTASWLVGKIPAEWLRRRLDRGGCLVMLDGLDEVADEAERRTVVAWAKRQIDQYPRNQYVITSRPQGYLSNPLTNADILQVRRFTGEQISRFLHGWYYAIECRARGETGELVRSHAVAKADDLLVRLRGQPALYDLAANPLLLTMIANVHRYRGALPGSRAALYGEMCEVLLHRRQEAKGLTADTGLTGEQKELVVRALATTMMTGKIRDISIKDAREAIKPALARVSPNVRPQAFLEQVHKSGLLVERESGVYAFAHLTLQEYLTAVRLRELQHLDRLTGSVDDPWWRETVMLWAAGADATPIIEACPASGSVRALALAFDCADEAREIHPDVRRELEGVLTAPTAGDAARDRLITAVKAARSLRDVVRLGDDTAVSTRPVTREIYALFSRQQEADGRLPTPEEKPGEDVGDREPAVGMWANDAVRFVAWLNGLFDDGTAFRLPTIEELADPAIGLVTDLTHHSIWAHGADHPQLHCSAGLTHPYRPPPGDRLHRPSVTQYGVISPPPLPATDRKRINSYLFLALAVVSDRARHISFGRGFDGDLVRVFDFGRDFDRDLDRDIVRAYELDVVRFLARVLDRDLVFVRDLVRDLDLARHRHRALKTGELGTVVSTYSLLIALWAPARSRGFKMGQALEHFNAFLSNTAAKISETVPTLPEDVAMQVQVARTLLEVASEGQPSSKDRALGELACRLAGDVHDLVEPILARTAPYDHDTIFCARVGLLAMAAAEAHLRERLPGERESAGPLIQAAFNGLTALQERVDGDLTPNEVLVLARA